MTVATLHEVDRFAWLEQQTRLLKSATISRGCSRKPPACAASWPRSWARPTLRPWNGRRMRRGLATRPFPVSAATPSMSCWGGITGRSDRPGLRTVAPADARGASRLTRVTPLDRLGRYSPRPFGVVVVVVIVVESDHDNENENDNDPDRRSSSSVAQRPEIALESRDRDKSPYA